MTDTELLSSPQLTLIQILYLHYCIYSIILIKIIKWIFKKNRNSFLKNRMQSLKNLEHIFHKWKLLKTVEIRKNNYYHNTILVLSFQLCILCFWKIYSHIVLIIQVIQRIIFCGEACFTEMRWDIQCTFIPLILFYAIYSILRYFVIY